MESTSISDVRRMCQRGAFRAYVQGGKVFLEDTATGQVVPLNGESGHAKAEREPAAHRQEQRGSRVERMFGKRDTWQAPTNPDADQGPYKGFLMVQCEECGAIKAFCAKHETYGYKCGECGHETPLEKLRPLFIDDVAYWERKYPGYTLNRVETRVSNAGWRHTTVIMRRAECWHGTPGHKVTPRMNR